MRVYDDFLDFLEPALDLIVVREQVVVDDRETGVGVVDHVRDLVAGEEDIYSVVDVFADFVINR